MYVLECWYVLYYNLYIYINDGDRKRSCGIKFRFDDGNARSVNYGGRREDENLNSSQL